MYIDSTRKNFIKRLQNKVYIYIHIYLNILRKIKLGRWHIFITVTEEEIIITN